MNQQEETWRLQTENHELQRSLKQALEELSHVREALRLALARIEELEKQRDPP
jgi:chromosome segregation ATPase